jgi:hypothetical protein
MRKDGAGQGQTTRGPEKSDPPMGPETLKGNARLAKPGDSERSGRSSPDWRNIYLYSISIPIGLALIVILAVLDVKSVFDPPISLLVLNTCFISLLTFLVAYTAMKCYLSSGSISLIMLAAGCPSLGLGSILVGFMPLTNLGLNGVVAIHNSSALSSSVFQ